MNECNNIQMAIGECLAYRSLPTGLKVKFAAWPTSWRTPLTDFHLDYPSESPHMALSRLWHFECRPRIIIYSYCKRCKRCHSEVF